MHVVEHRLGRPTSVEPVALRLDRGRQVRDNRAKQRDRQRHPPRRQRAQRRPPVSVLQLALGDLDRESRCKLRSAFDAAMAFAFKSVNNGDSSQSIMEFRTCPG